LLRYDAVLFDVDGTLLDSAPGILHTLGEVFRQMGVDPAGLDLRRYLGPPLRRTFGEHFADEAKIELATQLYRASYKEKGSHECLPYPGVKEMLERLHAAGLFLATATSKPTSVVEPILREQGLASCFDFIAGASMDKSRDTKTEVIRYVLAQPALQGKRVLMVGDRKDDMHGAADCGLEAAAVLYGYGSREELAPFAPIFYAGSCAELADFLLSSCVGNENETKRGTSNG
jgi:phosphoglycolate phosphatase